MRNPRHRRPLFAAPLVAALLLIHGVGERTARAIPRPVKPATKKTKFTKHRLRAPRHIKVTAETEQRDSALKIVGARASARARRAIEVNRALHAPDSRSFNAKFETRGLVIDMQNLGRITGVAHGRRQDSSGSPVDYVAIEHRDAAGGLQLRMGRYQQSRYGEAIVSDVGSDFNDKVFELRGRGNDVQFAGITEDRLGVTYHVYGRTSKQYLKTIVVNLSDLADSHTFQDPNAPRALRD